MKNKLIFSALIIAMLSLISPALLTAQGEPEPGAGRVSLIDGSVSTRRGDSGDWVQTTINAPVSRGDNVSTADHSRTEVQLDYADVMRLDQQSSVEVADLTRTRIQLQLAQGNMNYSVFKGTEAETEIDTPNVAVRPNGAGSFRIQVNPDGNTEVVVREGQAEVSTPQGSVTVQKGQSIDIQGTENPQYQVNGAPERDGWDKWNDQRDRKILDAQSWHHTNRYYTGSDDLDPYGRWHNVPGYGDVWSPDAGADWTPYSDGRWVWEPYYGWTWVSYEPWGWAPYHYGRWMFYGGMWDWWPGPVYPAYYPVWAPAYVSFFGFGGGHFGFGVGFGFGRVGWCPIGPSDPFNPWWGRGFNRSYNTVNITNITNITNINNGTIVRPVPPLAAGNRFPRFSNLQGAMTNAGIRRGVTVVDAQKFGSERVMRGAPISAAEFRGGQMVQGNVPVVPTRQSLSPSGRMASAASIPRAAMSNRTFFTKSAPPAGPQPFATRAAQVQQMVERHNSAPVAARAAAGNQATVNAAPERGSANTPNATRGFAGARPEQAAQPNASLNPRSGWQQFGKPAPSAAPRPTFNSASRANANIQSAPRAATPAPIERGRVTPQAAPEPGTRSGWRGFGSPNPQPNIRQQAAPQPTRSAPQPFSNAPRQAAPAPRENPASSRGWQGFSRQPAPTQNNRNYSAPRAQPAPSNWGGYSPSPRNSGNERPSIGYSKPIVTERAPSNYGGGYNRGGSYGGAAPRASYGGGGSAPRGGSYGGGGGSRGGGGGSSHSSNGGDGHKH